MILYIVGMPIVIKKWGDRAGGVVVIGVKDGTFRLEELFRPDCLFIMKENKIESMSRLTNKELRYAHNLQKLYKSGAFNE